MTEEPKTYTSEELRLTPEDAAEIARKAEPELRAKMGKAIAEFEAEMIAEGVTPAP